MDPIVIPCPAKVNLTLRVIGKRPDGYHDIDSIMAPLTLADTLTITPADDEKIHFTCDVQELEGDDNLVVKAARALKEAIGVTDGATMHLEKKIPIAAGLGGGSSDAAGTLKGLSRLWGVSLPDDDLLRLAASLGADVPFFLHGAPARAEGIGERLTPLGAMPAYHLLLVKPPFGVASGDAYKVESFPLEPDPDPEGTVDDILSGIPRRLSMRMVNDLEAGVFALHPALSLFREMIQHAKPAPVAIMMSGSGPTLYALYLSAEESWQAERTLQGTGAFVKAVITA